MLYTVEYEELVAGQTGNGVERFWLKRCEPFRAGISDNPESRAHKFAQLLQKEPATYREIMLVDWWMGESVTLFETKTEGQHDADEKRRSS